MYKEGIYKKKKQPLQQYLDRTSLIVQIFLLRHYSVMYTYIPTLDEIRRRYRDGSIVVIIFWILRKRMASRGTSTPLYTMYNGSTLYYMCSCATIVASPQDNNNNNKVTGRHVLYTHTHTHIYMKCVYANYHTHSDCTLPPTSLSQ